ncbi:MAG: N-acetyltransferase [Anaerolineae bacterium]|nr:N-acetyltransferase [Anaerolineae bacterium]
MDEEVTIRAARAADVPAMAAIINHYAAQNLMLPRSEAVILRVLDDFVAAEWDGRVIGCGALARLSPELAEVRSLAVSPDYKGKGLGRRIVLHLMERARARGYPQVCALTLVPDFFAGLGFQAVDRWAISPKIWQECVFCPKFHHCDEVAVVYNLTEQPVDLSMPSAAWEGLVAAFARREALRGAQRPE